MFNWKLGLALKKALRENISFGVCEGVNATVSPSL